MDKTFLAMQIYDEQVRLQWPGLAREVEIICSAIGIHDGNQSTVNKSDVDMAMQRVNRGGNSQGDEGQVEEVG